MPHYDEGRGLLSVLSAGLSSAIAALINGGTLPAWFTNAKVTTTLGVGSATPSASGAGISFPAVQAPSTDVNTLDDYEEGTFTPTFTPATGAFGSITVAGAGRYVKVGKTVFFWIDIRTTAATTIGTAAGQLYITGLPFTADANVGYGCASVMQLFNLSAATPCVGIVVEASQSRAYISKNSSNASVSNVQASEINLAAGSFNNLLGIFGQYQT